MLSGSRWCANRTKNISIMLNHFTKNSYFGKVFKIIPDVVFIEADYVNQAINYRVYNNGKYLSISINELK